MNFYMPYLCLQMITCNTLVYYLRIWCVQGYPPPDPLKRPTVHYSSIQSQISAPAMRSPVIDRAPREISNLARRCISGGSPENSLVCLCCTRGQMVMVYRNGPNLISASPLGSYNLGVLYYVLTRPPPACMLSFLLAYPVNGFKVKN